MPSRLRTYASFIRFSHTVFALPFALVGALLAAQLVAPHVVDAWGGLLRPWSPPGRPPWPSIAWLTPATMR